MPVSSSDKGKLTSGLYEYAAEERSWIYRLDFIFQVLIL
jgi:hypothetical protein